MSSTWQGQSLVQARNHNFPISSVHCVGENHNRSTAWEYRSCEITNLCFDTYNEQFVVFRSEKEARLHQFYASSMSASDFQSTVSLSTLLSGNLSAVSLTPLLESTRTAKPWFPSVIDESKATRENYNKFYFLPEHVVWVPWYPSAHPSRHWLWTDWWPIFVLGNLFPLNLKRKGRKLLPVVPPSIPLNSSQKDRVQRFQEYYNSSMLHQTANAPADIICARHAVVGLGRFVPVLDETDGTGHAKMLRKFALHVQRTLDKIENVVVGTGKAEVLFSTDSLSEPLQKSIQNTFPNTTDVGKLDFRSQLQAFARAQILVMTLSHECWAPLFVPNHATVVILYEVQELNDFVDCVFVLNNAAHFQVKWIEISSTTTLKENIAALIATLV